MSDKYADLIAGSLLSQELLVRYLEEQGVIEKGGFHFELEKHLESVSPARRDHVMYGPIRGLLKALGKPAPVARRKH